VSRGYEEVVGRVRAVLATGAYQMTQGEKPYEAKAREVVDVLFGGRGDPALPRISDHETLRRALAAARWDAEVAKATGVAWETRSPEEKDLYVEQSEGIVEWALPVFDRYVREHWALLAMADSNTFPNGALANYFARWIRDEDYPFHTYEEPYPEGLRAEEGYAPEFWCDSPGCDFHALMTPKAREHVKETGHRMVLVNDDEPLHEEDNDECDPHA